MNVTITLDADLLRETILALRDRQHTLECERRHHTNPVVAAIVERQLAGVNAALEGLTAAEQTAARQGA